MIMPIEDGGSISPSPFLNDRIIDQMNLKPGAKQIFLNAMEHGCITPQEISGMIPTASVKDRTKLKETIQQITKLLVSINVKIQIEVTHTHTHVHKHTHEVQQTPKPRKARIKPVELNPEEEEKLEKLFPKGSEAFSDKEINPEPDEIPEASTIEEDEPTETDVMLAFDDSARVNFYYRRIRQYPLLSSEEEVELAKLTENGDIAARNKFMLHNLRLVLKIARQYINRGLDYDDLVQEGNIGLLTATERFDYRKGFKFSTYAYWWIRQHIARAVMDFGGTVRMPCHAHETRNKIVRKMGELAAELEREPTVDEISMATGIDIDIIKRTLTYLRFTYQSLDEIIESHHHKSEGSDATYGDSMPDPSAMDPLTFVESREKLQEESESIQILLATLRTLNLPDRNKDVFKAYYSLDGVSEGLTLEDIGLRYGVTRERIRQLNEKVWDELQAAGITMDDADLTVQLNRIDELDKIVGEQTVFKETTEQLERAQENQTLEYRIAPDFHYDIQAIEITPALIVEIVACAYGITVESVKQRREWKYIWTRNIAAHLMHLDLGMQFPEIQAFFGTQMSEKRYRSSVIRLAESSNMQSDVEKIRSVYRKLIRVPEVMPLVQSTARILDNSTHYTVTEGVVWDRIVETVFSGIAAETGVTVVDIKGKDRHQRLAKARQLATYILRTDFLVSRDIVATVFDTDGSTVRYNQLQAQAELETNLSLRATVQKVRNSYSLTMYDSSLMELRKAQEILFPKQLTEAKIVRDGLPKDSDEHAQWSGLIEKSEPQKPIAEPTDVKVTDTCWSTIVQTVLRGVGQETGFTSEDLIGSRKFRKLTAARRVAVYILYSDFLAKKTEEIAVVFGFYDGTILHPLLKKVEKELKNDGGLRALIEKVRDSYTLAFYSSSLPELQKRQKHLFPKQLPEAKVIRDTLYQPLTSMQALLLALDESDRNKSVFSTRYGLDGSFKINTLEEVGERHENITRERVRQITSSVWEKLKSKPGSPFSFAEEFEKNIADWNGWNEIIRASEPLIPAIPDHDVPSKPEPAMKSIGKASFETIVSAVAQTNEITSDEIIGRSGGPKIVLSRDIAMYLLHKDMEMPIKEIASRLTRSEAGIKRSIQSIEVLLEAEKEARKEIKLIRKLYS